MKIAIVYVYPERGAAHHGERALKFLSSYHAHPPGMEHDSVVVCNGGPADDETRFLFASLPNLTLIEHDDSGWDIGAQQKAARDYPCDLMVFFGGNSYFKGTGWMIKMVEAWNNGGDTLYGSTGNQGAMGFGVYPHVRTTGYWISRALFNRYPIRVTGIGGGGQRYEFEHGATGLTTWIARQGKTPYIVSWSGMVPVYSCDSIPNGFRSGDGSNVLVGDRMTEPPYGPG